MDDNLERRGREEGRLYVVCMCCGRQIGVISAQGAPGGVSHGLCQPLCPEGRVHFGWLEDVQRKQGEQ